MKLAYKWHRRLGWLLAPFVALSIWRTWYAPMSRKTSRANTERAAAYGSASSVSCANCDLLLSGALREPVNLQS